MSSVTKRPPIKGYTKKNHKDHHSSSQSKPETNQNLSSFMFVPPLKPHQPQLSSTGQSHDSIILKRLEDMTRRMDLLQNTQSLSSATQFLQSQSTPSPAPLPSHHQSLQLAQHHQRQPSPPQIFQPQPPSSYQSSSLHTSPRPMDLKTSFSPKKDYSPSPQEAFANKVYHQYPTHTPQQHQQQHSLDHHVSSSLLLLS
jgi:hypothetical protein